MEKNRYIEVIAEDHTGHVILNRPEVHNAFNIEMIREISGAVRNFSADDDIRLIVFAANGKNFSAGADLEWMKKGMDQSLEELENESRELALLFNDIYNAPAITLSLLKGKVIGGANGIVAASDFSYATTDTSFKFSEVRIGLLPATIAPYIVRKTGFQPAYEWMITGNEFSADTAFQKGLISGVAHPEKLDVKYEELKSVLLKNSPEAMRGIKQLFRTENLDGNPDDLVDITSRLIADFRISAEAQEGMRAFFEKRQPSWTDE